ncbi:MAG: crossover junction endodeoxyribonuclease RuvC [Propionicimonas sp.]|uniref:crossover junction endodeoxyribonuclease RuvC n=1 Tax=Propionicimonas sp. TaxID=1955623 RepID=UPI003D106EF7
MRVLGVDPGLTRCGVGVIEGTPGRPPRLVAVGVITTPADLALPLRLLRIEEGLTEWVHEHRPEVVAVERVFADQNVLSVIGTAQASGLAMLVAARAGLPVHTHTPTEVKASITGSGRAEKAQVGAMVARILKLDAPPRPADAADAVALAICHLWRGGGEGRIAEAVARQEQARQRALARQEEARQQQAQARRKATA